MPTPAQTSAPESLPKLAVTAPDAAAHGVPRFFTPTQFAALRQLGDALVPAFQGRPSASQAGAPQFLDFLLSQSPAAMQQLYRDGLDRLAAEGVSERTLGPLQAPYSYQPPEDVFGRFLFQAKSDFLQATVSSREYAQAAGRGRRGALATGYLWRNLD